MADKLRSGGSSPLKPVPPPKPMSASNDVTTKIEDLTAKFTHLEEKTSLLYVDMQEKNNQLSEEISHLRSDITALQRDHTSLQRNHTSLQHSHTSLQHNHAKLQKEHKVLHQRLAELNLYLEAFQTDFNKALSDQSSLKEEQEKLKTDVQRMDPDQHPLQSRVETLPIQRADVEEVQPSTDNVASPSHHHAGVEDVTVTQLVALVSRLQSQLSQLQTDHSQREAHIARLQTAQEELATSHSNMRGEMETSCSAIEELKTKLRKTRTLFSACNLNKDQSKYYKAMVFNTITNDKDGHYNAQTGVFTTPYAGLYIFTVTLASSSLLLDSFVHVGIMVDDTVVCTVSGGFSGGSACVPLSLEPGQHVWLKPLDAIKNYRSSNSCGSFSGTLVLVLP